MIAFRNGRYAAAAIEKAGQQPEWFRSKNISLRVQRTENLTGGLGADVGHLFLYPCL